MRTYLVLDTGLYVNQAAALADGGKNRVLYWTPWASWAPLYTQFAAGKNFKHVEKVFYWEKHVKEVIASDGCILNFDVANNGAIGMLRDMYPEASIFGSGWGQILEDDRIKLKQALEIVGLPMKGYEVVYGVEGPKGLREYLKTHEKVYVKLNRFRGEMESFFSKNYLTVKSKLEKFALILGPHNDDNDPKTGFPFVCEEMIDAEVESGFDGFFNGTDFISPCFCGYEWDKGPYMAKVVEYEDLPEPIFETMEALKPVLQRLKYRGAVSTEEKIVSPKEHFLIDICSRLPAPLSQIYPMAIKNYAEAMYLIGKGKDVRLEIESEYVGLFPVKDEEARDGYVQVEIKDPTKATTIFATADKEGNFYAVKGLAEIGTVMAEGDSLKDVCEKLSKNVEEIDSPDIDGKEWASNMEPKFTELFKAGKKVGIDL